jgi:Mce-associated membrane protein
VKPDDRTGDGTVGTVTGETDLPGRSVEELKSGRSKGEPAKGKTTKKAKGKSAKRNGAAEDRLTLPSAGGEERADPVAPSTMAFPADHGARPPGEEIQEEEPVAEGNNGHGQPASLDNGSAPETAEAVLVIGEDTGSDSGVSEVSGRPASEPSSTRRWMRSNTVLVGACVLIAGLAVALILSLLALSNQDAQASSRTSALVAARTYAVQLASYNYRDLERGFAAVVADSTPSFRRSFTESSDALKSTLTQYKATADASVVSAGLVSSGTSRAVALVFLTQRIANSTQTTPTTDRSQVQITLVRSEGRWLIDQVTLL